MLATASGSASVIDCVGRLVSYISFCTSCRPVFVVGKNCGSFYLLFFFHRYLICLKQFHGFICFLRTSVSCGFHNFVFVLVFCSSDR